MGRRKIEIQPITHERNRSVTFLKRKNGLFKKAYELGVLCSVDVAVIIFEARPGHEVKLHEYASSDIRNIVHRQSMHQGDTDLKVPADFSGSASKFDDGGDVDGDDDNGDEEEDLPVAKPSRRRAQGGLTFPSSNDDHNLPIPPPPPPAHRLHPESASGALLSVANDRVSNMRDLHPSRPNKRHRNARSRSPSEDTLMPALPAMNSEWGLSQDNHGSGGRYGRNARHLHNPPPPGLSQEHQYHSMHQQQHPAHGFQYTPLFPVPNQVSPSPAFIPLQDFGPSSRNLPPFSGGSRSGGSGGGGEGGSGYPDLHQRMRPSDSSGYDPAPYTPNTNSMTRHSEHHHHQQQQSLLSHPPPPPPSPPSASHRREDRGADGLFGSLLEADERNRQRSGTAGAGGGGGGGVLDWPLHDGLTLPGRSGASGAGPTSPRGSLDGPGMSNPANGSDSWFDFLSRSNPVNESHSSGSRRSSSSTWPKNNNNDMNNTRHKTGEDTFEGRKESAVRGEGRIGQDDDNNPIMVSPKQRTGEGDVRTGGGQADDTTTRSDEEKP